MHIDVNALSSSPILLDNAQAWRTYQGGKLIQELHNIPNAVDSSFPEEWIASTVTARNAGREHIVNEGLSFLKDDSTISLKDVIAASPSDFLGLKHASITNDETGVLIKLIDSCERLSIQVHPNKEKAKALFGSDYGKTECWHILGGRKINGENPHIYFGFKPGITEEYWKNLFYTQDIDEMLNCMHKFYVNPGDTFLINGGIPHAIGAGCFLAEIQEPTDYTIRVERQASSGLKIADEMCHQGIGFEKMFECFDFQGYSEEETKKRWFIKPVKIEENEQALVEELVGYRDTACFKMHKISCENDLNLALNESFSVLYLLEGSCRLEYNNQNISIVSGSQVFLPAQLKKLKIISTHSTCKMLHCFGPEI